MLTTIYYSLTTKLTGELKKRRGTNQMTKSYKEAGVDIDLANQIVKKIKPLIGKTSIPGFPELTEWGLN